MDRFRRTSPQDRRLAGAAVVVAAIVVVAAGLLLTSSQAPLPGTAVGSASAPGASPTTGQSSAPGSSGSPAASQTPVPSLAPDGDWAALDQPPFQPPVTLTAGAQDPSGVQPTATFTLRSSGGIDAATLARSLQVSPAAPFDVVPGPDSTTATVRPVGPLKAGTTYRFALADSNSTDLGSWAFTVKQPLHVVTTLPDDKSDGVPIDTGIEITFDQDGAADVASHVTIEPKVSGHTETHGRTFVFVPDRLAPRTLYTVTVHAGIAIAGSDQVLAHDVRFAFETGGGDDAQPITIGADRLMMETSPHDRATMVIFEYLPDGVAPITSLPVGVYRLGSQAVALTALRQLVDAPDWATYSRAGLVDISGLPRIASFTARLDAFPGDDSNHWFRFPMALPAGWYLVDIARPDRDIQAFLQVTDLATYSAITTTRSVVWVNDTVTHGAVAGATVTLAGGASLGRTDARGILVASTPKAILTRFDPNLPATGADVLVIRAPNGRTQLVGLGHFDESGQYYASDISGGGTNPADRFVRLLYTDRNLYRQTDRVNVWGLVQPRGGTALPGKTEIRLMGPSGDESPPIAIMPVTLGPTGAFSATIPLVDLPLGGYSVELWVGPIHLTGIGFTVDVIRKPDYAIAVTTDRHVLVVGDSVAVTAHLTFFDGTAVPDTQIKANGFEYGSDEPVLGTTNAAGIAVIKVPAVMDHSDGFDTPGMSATPVGPEEGSISGGSPVLVFPSSLWLDGKATVSGGRLSLTGSVHDVDIAGMERNAKHIVAQDAYLGTLDPRGIARPGIAVDAKIVEIIPVKTFAGRAYDFITKLAVDTYTYSTREESLGTRHLRSGAGGRIHLDMPVAHPSHGFQVTLTATDSRRRVVELSLGAEIPPTPADTPDLATRLTGAEVCGRSTGPTTFALGQTLSTTMVNGSGPLPTGGANRYLFVTAQRGLRSAVVQGSPTFSRPFATADVPNLSVLGVRFTGDTYAPAGRPFGATFDPSARALSVHLTTDAPAYGPGGLVTLTVETRDATGKPVPATVTLRAVDQKLFALGGAAEVSALGDLYTPVQDGIVRTHASRSALLPSFDGECGATGGGGDERSDFRDSLLFRSVTTGATGRATITFNVSDDLTSWHVSATAVTRALQAGSSDLLIPVRLPFFVDASLAPEYLVGDRPAVRVRAFGGALHTGDPVTFTVSSATLPMAATTVHGTAFQPIDIPLPALHVGDQTLTVSATSGSGSTARKDSLVRHFSVLASRLLTIRTGYAEVTTGLVLQHGDGLTTYLFSDAGRGRFLPFLANTAGSDGARLDQALAKAVAGELTTRYFGASAPGGTGAGDTSGGAAFDPDRYDSGQGLTLLPYSGPDLELSADAALVAPGHFRSSNLNDYFHSVYDNQEQTRERRLIALAGLAGIGAPVIIDVRAAAATTDLTPIEQLYVGLAAAALGDDDTALRMETALVAAHGQRHGPWIRLAIGTSSDDAIHGTALLEMLAAEIGDPLASAADAYVSTHPTKESVPLLLQVGYVQAAIAHATAAPGSFAYTVDGVRRVADMASGDTVRLTLTAGQAASLTLEPLTGKVGLATTWEAPPDLASTPVDPAVTIKRTWSPNGTIPASSVVAVTLTLTFNASLADSECYDVTDLAPSGLAPVSRFEGWPLTDDNGDPIPAIGFESPYAIEGQRVRFCAAPIQGSDTATLRYYMRIVTTGTYVWEPAVASSSLAPNGVARTDMATIVVR